MRPVLVRPVFGPLSPPDVLGCIRGSETFLQVNRQRKLKEVSLRCGKTATLTPPQIPALSLRRKTLSLRSIARLLWQRCSRRRVARLDLCKLATASLRGFRRRDRERRPTSLSEWNEPPLGPSFRLFVFAFFPPVVTRPFAARLSDTEPTSGARSKTAPASPSQLPPLSRF